MRTSEESTSVPDLVAGPPDASAAWTGFIRAAHTLRSEGSFAGLANLVPYGEINGLFASDLPARQTQGQVDRGPHQPNTR